MIGNYTSTPSRAALQGLGRSRNIMEALPNAAKRFGTQLGEGPSLALTGDELAQQTGAKEFEADAAGLGLDIVTDGTNIIPRIEAAKFGAKALGFSGKKIVQSA